MTKTNFSIIYKIIIIIIGSFAVFHGFFYDNFKLDIETAYYFTYQSNILVIVYFILDIINIIKKKETFYPRFKGAVTMSITVTFLVYHFLLSPTADDYKGLYYIRNIILHYILPIMTIFDYIIFDKKGIYKIVDPLLWLIIPFVYFAFILIRARIGSPFSDGSYYPYFFVDIDKYGLKTVLRNVFFITLFFDFLGYIEYFIDRFFNKVISKHNK
ncbi:Pr6Pr family membrane protein [Brachyspira hyodysenteriae]|uniref:Pr6Pr family membrane protein n=1 Tax=Brachyspira hyodysenteriae TaxID=159 RepID=UPI0022CD50F7|nr:Pr6Pr family membrane protein [Brachyspira hyodysenteriae]MCZ9955320.1 Pr6Pr family membrane protein [Brachyspira hyodysenteriae]